MKKAKRSKSNRAQGEVFQEFLSPGYAMPTPVPYGLPQSDITLNFERALVFLLAGLLTLITGILLLRMLTPSTVNSVPAGSIPINTTIDATLAPLAQTAATTAGESYKQFQSTAAIAAFQPAPNQVQVVGSTDFQPSISSYSLQGSVGTTAVPHPGLR